MKLTYKIFGLLLVTALLSACAGYGHVQATANRFHELSTDHNGATIAILPANKNVSESLEFKTYRQKLAAHLSTEGFVVVSVNSNTPARLTALLNYGIGDGQTVTDSYSVPIWGQTGVSSSTTTGSVNMYGNYGSYSGTTFYTPTYGITGFTSGTTTSTQYNRAVHLDIFDNQPSSINPSKIYESKVISTGSCGVISEVIDEMFDALFRNFRGESGSSNKYMIEGTFNC